MTDQRIIERALEHEQAGLRYCFTCSSWEDDTDCFAGDHSRHCGHELKPLGFEMSRAYRLISTERIGKLFAVQDATGNPVKINHEREPVERNEQ